MVFANERLKICDTYVNSNIEIPFKAHLKSLELRDKYIYLSRHFILLNEKIFMLIQGKFCLLFSFL